MDTKLTHAIYKSEELYNRRKTSRTASLLILRYIEATVLLSDKIVYLQKAMNTVINTKLLDMTDVSMQLFEIYIYMELEQYDTADDILKKLKSFKGWYKTQKPNELAVIFLLLSKSEFKKSHNIRGKRYYKLFSEQIVLIKNNNIFKILQYMFINKYMPNEQPESFNILYSAYTNGSRSPWLYIQIYSMFLYEQKDFNNSILLNRIIKWSIVHGIDNVGVLTAINFYFENHLKSDLPTKISFINTIELIYNNYKIPTTLDILCKIYINEIRIDKTALEVYIKAKAELTYIERLDYIYLMAAYKNDYYNIEPKTIQKIISNVELKEELQAFVYHLILTDDNMKYMQPPNQYKILNFGKMAFEKNFRGIYYNSIYMFMLENNIDNMELQKYIFEQLFAYEITINNPDIKYIWINEKEKQETESYVVKENRVIINASSPNFSIYCLGQKQRNFYNIENSITTKKLLIYENKNMYTFFLDNKIVNINLIITFARYYMKQKTLTEEAVSLLKSIFEINGISNDFKSRVSILLGKYFTNRQEYEIASGYFSILKPEYLDNEEINIAIIVFLQTRNIERAIMLCNSRKDVIEDKIKLYMCILAINNKICEKQISYISFELLLKGRNERQLLNNIINFYDGTLQDWIDIKKMFESMKIETLLIKEKILSKSLYIHKVDEYIQDIFVDMYKNNNYNNIIKNFIEYTIYTILTAKKSIKDDLLECLEKEYTHNNDEYLQYAIASIYVTNNIELNSFRHIIFQNAIKAMIKKGIMFPVFKEYKDRKGEFLYLEKNTPFVYNTLPDKDLYLNYKLKNESEWHKKKMKYEKFGLYMTVLVMFHNEVLEYYLEEENDSISERTQFINRGNAKIREDTLDEYYNINNAIIYAETLKYSEIENIILAQQNKKSYIRNFGHLI